MRTLHLGPEELLVAAKIAVTPSASAEALARDIDTVEARIRTAVPIARVIYLEPDIYSARAANLRSASENVEPPVGGETGGKG